jgi:hypothetical protein
LRNGVTKELTAQDSGECTIGFFNCWNGQLISPHGVCTGYKTNSSGNATLPAEHAAWIWKEWTDILLRQAGCKSLANPVHPDLE